jgi:hypothetical protein
MADAEERFGGGGKKKPEKKGRGARADKHLKTLKKEAARQVAAKSGKLVDALMEKALKGDVASAKMVVTLAETKEGAGKPKKRRKRGLSTAQRLALEPPWVDPGDEAGE